MAMPQFAHSHESVISVHSKWPQRLHGSSGFFPFVAASSLDDCSLRKLAQMMACGGQEL
jgi:hypothetical protein